MELDIFVEPPLDFGGESWALNLEKAEDVEPQGVSRSQPVEISGSAVIEGVETGEYDSEVRDHAGDVWWNETIDVYPSMPAIFAEIESRIGRPPSCRCWSLADVPGRSP